MWLGHFDLNKNKANKQKKEFQGLNLYKGTFFFNHTL